MKVKLGNQAVLPFFDSSSAIGTEAFVVAVVDPNGDAVSTVDLTAVGDVPDLYISEEVLFSLVGQYVATYTYGDDADTIVLTKTIDVGKDPVSDYPRAEAVTVAVDQRVAGGDSETVELLIIDSDSAEFLAAEEAAYDADRSDYSTSATFSVAGQYFLVWTKDDGGGNQLPFQVVPLLILTPSGAETVTLTAATEEGNNGQPHTATTVVVATSGGVHVEATTTDIDGEAVVTLDPGSYIISLLKDGVVFTNNNFAVDILNTREISNEPIFYSASKSEAQVFQLVTASVTPTYTAPATPTDMCTLFADLYMMDGKPLIKANVHVRLIHTPLIFSGTGVFDTNKTYKTDSNGHVEFDLVQGIKIEVSIAPLSLRRIIDVPTGDDAVDDVNLLTLLSGADDVFDIIAPEVPAAPRRSLT